MSLEDTTGVSITFSHATSTIAPGTRKVETPRSSETMEQIYQSMRCQVLNVSHVHSQGRENLKYRIK
jgi:hypothetical protein